MPDNIKDTLSKQDVRNLVEFLASLTADPKPDDSDKRRRTRDSAARPATKPPPAATRPRRREVAQVDLCVAWQGAADLTGVIPRRLADEDLESAIRDPSVATAPSG